MGAIVLDASKVNSYVLPNLVKSKNTMQDAYSTSQSLRNSLPSSFTYRSTVNDIVNQLYNIKREISDIDTMISKKVEKAKTIENRNDNRASGIAKAASSIGSIVGTIGGAAIGSATGGVVGAVAGAVVGNKIGNSVGKGLANTGAKIWNGATKVVKGIWDGIKNLGKSIWNGCKKVAKSIASFVKEAVSGLVKAAKAVWGGLKWVWNEVIVRTAASIVNFVISVVKGIAQLVGALIDGVVMIAGGVASIFTGIVDGCQAIYGAITGKEWHSITKAMWTKKIMPFVSTQYVNGVADSLYQTGFGKWLDNNAYGWFKSDGIACDIGSAVGYVAGIILLTIATAGIGTAATGAATAASSTSTAISTTLAAVAATGKSADKNFNAIKDKNGSFENVTGTQITKAVAGSYANGAIEGVAWYFTYGSGAKAIPTGKKGMIETLAGKTKLTSKYASKLAKLDKINTETIVNKIGGSKVVTKALGIFGNGKAGKAAEVLLKPSVVKAKMGIQFGKTYANAYTNAWATDTEVDKKKTLIEATVNAGVAGFYEKIGTQIVKKAGKSLVDKYDAKALNANDKSVLSEIDEFVDDVGGFAGESLDDAVQLSATQQVVETTIEAGTSKVGGKLVKETYTGVVEGVINLASN